MPEDPGVKVKPPDIPTSQPAQHQHPPTRPAPAPDQKATTKAWALGGASEGTSNMRTFEQIIEDEKANRNILEIHLSKNPTRPKNLTFDDIGEFIFDVLKIKPEDCLGFDYTTGRYDTRQVKMKPEIDTAPYITPNPISFMDHEITVKKQLSNVTKVLFKNVPLNVPDEEILNLCLCYGTVLDNKVNQEKMFNTRNKGMPGSNRSVEMVLDRGAALENYYWMEGPLPGDSGRRITVIHNGQIPQCSNCLLNSFQGCKAAGNGKLCEELKTPRTKMATYMESLRHKVGYISLKLKYAESQARNFPSLTGNIHTGYTMEENQEVVEDGDIVPMNPLDEKNKKIVELEKALEAQKKETANAEEIKNDLNQARAELNTIKKDYKLSQKKLQYTKNATEQKMVETISNPNYYRDDPHLISVYSATLNTEDFDFEEEENEAALTPKDENFLKKVEDSLDKNDAIQAERYSHTKNQILERVKLTKSRQRTFSNSSVGSLSSIVSTGSSKRKNSGSQNDLSAKGKKSALPVPASQVDSSKKE